MSAPSQTGTATRRRPQPAGSTGRAGFGVGPRWPRSGPRPWWALAGVLAALAAVAVFTSAPLSYVADNRFEQYWSPGRVLARLPVLWDAGRGLGRPRGEFALLPSLFTGPVRGLGLPAALAERLWHATLLVSAGLGLAMLLRFFRPRFGPEHLMAGVLYAFNPFSAVFLVPSGLFVNYAIAPWVLLAFAHGVCGRRPWRWAAIFALLVAASGGADPPGLLYTLVLILPTGLYLVGVERRTTWRCVAAWLGRAAVLAAAVMAATTIQILSARGALTARLLGTESVEAVQSTTSWAESWRGLGFWVSYFSDNAGPLRPHELAYLSSAPVVVATFAFPCLALATLAWSRWRPRILMAGMALLSVTLMVGAFPTSGPSPLGRLLLSAYRELPLLTALRTSYKAGAGLAAGVACLVGVGVVAAIAALRPRGRTIQATVAVAVLLVFGLASFPFWSGRLYHPGRRVRAVPAYWRSAVAWLDHQPGDGRVLIVPGTLATRYRWGDPGDDIFDALLARPHVIRTSLPLSTAQASNLVGAVDDGLQSTAYAPGTLAPVARRLGIEYLVIRNDLDWQRLGRPRPASFEALRGDPGLERAASFGRPGENVARPGDDSPEAAAERGLAPVEVLRFRDQSPAPTPSTGPGRQVTLLAPGAPLLVAGDGSAWLRMAARGLLDGPAPVRYVGAADDGTLDKSLRDGGRVLVTDTNRRRTTRLTGIGHSDSQTLAAGESGQGLDAALFDAPGSQTTAFFTAATAITNPGRGHALAGLEPWSRPANAFDGDPHTWWLTESLTNPVGRSVRVAFDVPVELSVVGVAPAPLPPPGRSITRASLRFSDGSAVPFYMQAGGTRVSFPARTTRSLEVRIDAVTGPGQGPVGLAEVTVPSTDLAEVLQVPDDLFRAADRDPAVREGLTVAPVAYLFERLQGEGPRDVELQMRRRFRTAASRSYRLDGSLVASPTAPGPFVDIVAGSPAGTCIEGIVTVDGRPVPVTVEGAPEALLAGRPVPFHGCAELGLESGWHRMDAGGGGSGVLVNATGLATGSWPASGSAASAPISSPARGTAPAPASASASAEVVGRDRSGLRLRLRAPAGGALLVTGQAYDSNWSATIGGRSLGPPQAVDTQNAWALPAEGTYEVVVRYRPQRVYDWAVGLTVVGLVACGWLAVSPARRRSSTVGCPPTGSAAP